MKPQGCGSAYVHVNGKCPLCDLSQDGSCPGTLAEATTIAKTIIGAEPASMDALILNRLKTPFSYEPIQEKTASGVHTRIRYRIRDANDDAIASSYEEVYAKLIVDSLNSSR